MKKKLCMLMALLMVCLSAAACAETIELKVWSAQPDQALLEELCNAFAAEHPENEWKFTYGVVGEADAQARYLEDPAAAADVFSYPDDQIIKLVKADADGLVDFFAKLERLVGEAGCDMVISFSEDAANVPECIRKYQI